MTQEKLKLQNIGATLELEPATLMHIDSKMIEATFENDSVRKMSIDNLEVDQ